MTLDVRVHDILARLAPTGQKSIGMS